MDGNVLQKETTEGNKGNEEGDHSDEGQPPTTRVGADGVAKKREPTTQLSGGGPLSHKCKHDAPSAVR